ncbi:hypothetical protein EVAR_36570_1 [Eumeta japonica]|uniref:Uncharacterized protein n=1 Tax=Eumeta variegata TaxID=151549 RepID=A0A4C1XYW4_EUMVA|nr:hypothetical protein EVAR_36570_1 [Eumeta japonica]
MPALKIGRRASGTKPDDEIGLWRDPRLIPAAPKKGVVDGRTSHEQASHQRIDDYRRPWTFAIPEESPVRYRDERAKPRSAVSRRFPKASVFSGPSRDITIYQKGLHNFITAGGRSKLTRPNPLPGEVSKFCENWPLIPASRGPGIL